MLVMTYVNLILIYISNLAAKYSNEDNEIGNYLMNKKPAILFLCLTPLQQKYPIVTKEDKVKVRGENKKSTYARDRYSSRGQGK